MTFDYKKEYRDIYLPKEHPSVVEIPKIQYVVVRGQGNPNEKNGEYAEALGVLYGISYTIKMSYKGSRDIAGYFPYVVPPLEGLWWMADGSPGVDYNNKSDFCWISMIRLPEFVTPEVFEWAKAEAAVKKKIDTSRAEWLDFTEGLCVQIMHCGAYDNEPAAIEKMDAFAAAQGYKTDFCPERRHHEIYLNDPRKTAPEKLKTVIRHPIRKA
ncbi:MAG: GyrI-like domain-containing protein [Bacillota bacterium]